jgi:ribosomal protein L37AE/L43A
MSFEQADGRLIWQCDDCQRQAVFEVGEEYFREAWAFLRQRHDWKCWRDREDYQTWYHQCPECYQRANRDIMNKQVRRA